MITNPLMNQMISQIVTNLIHMTLDEKLDNPYLNAALKPIVSTFVYGVMNGSDFSQMGETYQAIVKENEVLDMKNGRITQ